MDSSESIAVIGMAGRFPAASSVAELWSLLRDGGSALWSPSDEELLELGARREALRDPAYVRARMRFEGFDRFDAGFFGYSARHAQMLDPQHRLFLEGAWEALETAGYDPRLYDGLIGVFASCGTNVYMLDRSLLAYRDVGSWRKSQWADLLIDADKDHIATRVSYKLGLTGPSVCVQTTCSSSLAAVHLASQSLLRGECDIALAGGISLISCQRPRGYLYVKDGMDSPDGHCRAFDADAAGTAWGSGFGIVVLKRCEDAQRDRDHLHALIEGTAMNNDGDAKMGYTAPSVRGQQEVIALAQAVAGVSPDDIDAIEAHGTGTSLGDSIELAALIELFGSEGEAGRRQWPCALGSIKTNIGHLDVAAGVTGLIKTVLCLEHRALVPSLDFSTPNPALRVPDCPLAVNTEYRPWPSESGRPRRAGVSSLGFGGTNVHAIVREAPEAQRPPDGPAGIQVIPLSARSPAALERGRRRLAAHLRAYPRLDPGDVAFTLQIGRRRFSHRQVIVADGRDQLLAALDDPAAPLARNAASDRMDTAVVFVCSDEVAPLPRGLLEAICATDAAFQRDLDECLRACRVCVGLDRLVSPDDPPADPAAAREQRLALEYAVARWWQRRGVEPARVLGQGVGAVAAACIAGQLTLEQAMRACVSGAHRPGDVSIQAVGPPQQQEAREKRAWRDLVRDLGCVLLQLAPGGAWERLLDQTPSGEPRPVLVQSFAAGEHDQARQLPNAVAALWLHGVPIDWQRWHVDESRKRVPLPTYPFERRRYWLPVPEVPGELQEPSDETVSKQAAGQRFFVPSWHVASPGEHAGLVLPEPEECWLILADDELAPQVAKRLEEEGCVTVLVRAGQQYRQTGAREFSVAADLPADYPRLLGELRAQGLQPRRVVHCWSLVNAGSAAITAESFREQQTLGYFSLLYLAKALAMHAQSAERSLVVVTRGTYRVADADSTCNLANAPMTGLCKVMAQEIPELRCAILDLEGGVPEGRTGERGTVEAQRVLDEVLQHGAADPAVACRGGLRLVQALEERRLSADLDSIRELRERGVYVITGGLGRIGLALARRLAGICKARLVLLTRNAFPDRSDWQTVQSADNAALAAKVRALLEIEALGSQVAVHCADVRSEAQLESAFTRAEARFGPIAGVFHLAAEMKHHSMSCPLTQLSRQDVAAQLGPKVEGFYALRSTLRRRDPDFVMLFSSNSSILGGFGFAAYAAANAFLDHCACARLDDPFQWLCSNWDRWSDQAPGTGDGERYTIGMDEGLDALATLMSRSTASQVIVATGALHERRERWVLQRQRPVAQHQPHPASSTTAARVLPRTELEQAIAQVWQDVLGCDEIGVEDNFLDLGGDSLIGLRILSRLRELFQVEVPLKALLGPRPTVASLVPHLVAELERSEAVSRATDRSSLSDEDDSPLRPARPSAGSPQGPPH